MAIIGVIVLPISSGDTAFRSARLIVADTFNFEQKLMGKRLLLAIPLFIVGIIVSQAEFGVIWRYFGWANQTLATIVLWAGAAYMIKHGRNHWIGTIPATFMTAVAATYLAYAKIGCGLPLNIASVIGVIVAIGSLATFLIRFHGIEIESDELLVEAE